MSSLVYYQPGSDYKPGNNKEWVPKAAAGQMQLLFTAIFSLRLNENSMPVAVVIEQVPPPL